MMIITLCGSARFEPEFHLYNKLLTIKGHSVFSLTAFPSVEGQKNWYTEDIKQCMDAAYLNKIDASDAVFIITQKYSNEQEPEFAYIGNSLKNEIAHTNSKQKKIFWDFLGLSQVPTATFDSAKIAMSSELITALTRQICLQFILNNEVKDVAYD